MNKVEARAQLLNQFIYIAPFVRSYTHDLFGDPKQHVLFRIKRSSYLQDSNFSAVRDVHNPSDEYMPKGVYE